MSPKRIAGCLLILLVLAAAPCRAAEVRKYWISGVNEVGGGMSLHSDGRFEFGMSYGAVDRGAKGRWHRRGSTLELITDAGPAPGFSVAHQLGHDPAARDGEPPLVLRVKVASSQHDLVWSNVHVVAQFSNGQERTGTTGRGGLLGFVARSEPVWQGARVERIQLRYEAKGVQSVWLPVNPGAKFVEVEFELGQLLPAAFGRLVLEEVDKGHRLVVREGDLPKEWTFLQR